jgi:8-amino-7-oxononanoate synthase
MPALHEFAREQLAEIARGSLTRSLRPTERLGGARVRRGGRLYTSFSCNDYLGLAHDPRVIAAAHAAIDRSGAGAGASRLVTGCHAEYAELENLLAQWKGAERALVFGSGYLANLGLIPALAGKPDLILADRLSHACTWDGVKLSGAKLIRFGHNDLDHCRALLREHRAGSARCLILSETVFSMDGDLSPLSGLAELAREFDAWLITDDAHGLGISESHGADIQMGTLSKAAGSYGGYVCARREVIAFLENRARSLIFSTGLPPASVAAAAAAVKIMMADPELARKPVENARLFTSALARPPAQSPIVPVIVGEPERALAASAMLESEGFLVVPIRPPTVPPGSARLRFAFSVHHDAESIDRVASLLKRHGYV